MFKNTSVVNEQLFHGSLLDTSPRRPETQNSNYRETNSLTDNARSPDGSTFDLDFAELN